MKNLDLNPIPPDANHYDKNDISSSSSSEDTWHYPEPFEQRPDLGNCVPCKPCICDPPKKKHKKLKKNHPSIKIY